MRRLAVLLCMVSIIGPAGISMAEESSRSSRPGAPAPPSLLQENTINTMIDLVTRSVSRRYDLRPTQAETAKQMLEKNTREFVSRNFMSLVALVPQVMEMRNKAMTGEDLTREQAQQMARQMQPIYSEAVNIIISENEKFHEILDDRQKAIHKMDMDRMRQDVAETEERLARWSEGGYESGELLGGRPGAQRASRRHAAEEPEFPEIMRETSFNFWDTYVQMFIQAFQLEKGQIPMAYSILNDMKNRAKAYREDHGREYANLLAKIEELSNPGATQPAEGETLEYWQAKLEEMEQPLLEMFEELKERLMAIPTDQQRKAAQEVLGGGSTSQPAQSVQETQPAQQTQPAEAATVENVEDVSVN